MKRLLVAICFIMMCCPASHAESGIIGKWIIKFALLTTNSMVFDFGADGTLVIWDEDGIVSLDEGQYSYDPVSGILSWGSSVVDIVEVRVEIVNGTRLLVYFTDQSLQQEDGGEFHLEFLDEDDGGNEVTKEFNSKFNKGMVELIKTIPIAIGIRI